MVPTSGCSFLSEVLCTVTSKLNKNIREADGRRNAFLGVPEGQRGPEEGKHDWEVQAMMAHLPALDWEYLRWRARACGLRQRM
jgi:hypothetical protein